MNDLSAALDKLRADLAAVQKTAETAGGADTAALERLGDKVAALETTVSALQQAGSQQQAVDLGPLNERLDALDAGVKAATDAASKEDGRVAALEQSLSQLSGKVEAQASQPKIALAIAASALKSALDRGTPFTSEWIRSRRSRPTRRRWTRCAPCRKGVPAAPTSRRMDGRRQRHGGRASPWTRMPASPAALQRPVAGESPASAPCRGRRAGNSWRAWRRRAAGDYCHGAAEYDALP